MGLLVVTLVIADLVAVEDGPDKTASSWNRKVHSCRNRIVEAVPLTSIKIVLVAWQILTQVRGHIRTDERLMPSNPFGAVLRPHESHARSSIRLYVFSRQLGQ